MSESIALSVLTWDNEDFTLEKNIFFSHAAYKASSRTAKDHRETLSSTLLGKKELVTLVSSCPNSHPDIFIDKVSA